MKLIAQWRKLSLLLVLYQCYKRTKCTAKKYYRYCSSPFFEAEQREQGEQSLCMRGGALIMYARGSIIMYARGSIHYVCEGEHSLCMRGGAFIMYASGSTH